MKRITTAELNQHAIESLGLDPSSLDLTTVEGAAGALRRAAGFLCPCSQAELTGQVAQSMQDIVKDSATQTELIESTLEALIAYGDLVESRAVALDQPNNPTTLLYLTPPTFVARNDGSIFLLGIAPDDFSPLPADYAKRIEYDGHVRRISAQADESLPSCLSEFGFFELSMEQWLRTPPPEPATHHLLRLNDVVSRAAAAGSIADIRILDPAKSVRYYPGRWAPLRSQTGMFVARRPQAWGADLWCYIQVENGQVAKLVDFPQFEKRWRACDEAWRLQAAIDACNLTPQNYRIRPGPTRSTSILDLFSPLPQWAQRRWDFLGRPVPRSGSLFSYVLPAAALDEEIAFMKNVLWLIDIREAG